MLENVRLQNILNAETAHKNIVVFVFFHMRNIRALTNNVHLADNKIVSCISVLGGIWIVHLKDV